MSFNSTASNIPDAAARLPLAARQGFTGGGVGYLVGLAVAALVPGLFWTVLIELACLALGVTVSWSLLAAFGGGVVALLAAVFTRLARGL